MSDEFYHLGADAAPAVPLVLAPKLYEAEERKWLTKKWFTDPTWKGGPPRWQIGIAGSVVGVGVIALLSAALKRK